MSARKKWLRRSGIHHQRKFQSKLWNKSRLGKRIENYRFNRKYKRGKAVEGIDFYEL